MPQATSIPPIDISSISTLVNQNYATAPLGTANTVANNATVVVPAASANAAANTAVARAANTVNNRVPQQGKTTNPTLASQPRGTPVLQSITYADPNAAAAIIQQAAQKMLMLSMMGNLSSPAGLTGIMAGSLGGMFSNLINAYGIGPIVGMINKVLPGIGSVIGNTLNYALDQAISNTLQGRPSGFKTQQSINAANQTVASVAAINTATAATVGLTSSVATLGGPALGIDLSSLTAIIASAIPGTNIKQTVYTDNGIVELNIYVATNEIQLSLPSSPSFAGDEHISLTDLTADALTQAIIREIKLAGSPSLVTQQQFANIVNRQYTSVVNNGLQQILGYGINQLLNNALSMVFPGSGNMYNPPVDLYFRSLLNPGYVTQSRIQSIKNIALSRVAYDTANMFINSPYMTGSNMALGLANQVSQLATGQSLQMAYRGLVFNALRRI